jgi:hypothetical protein
MAAQPIKGSHGADGAGDPYFPTDGNGGYDVSHYDLTIGYDPATDVLTGRAVITARATQGLTRFDLDLKGLTVRGVTVNGATAKAQRKKDELVVTPASTIADGTVFTTIVTYDGVPVPVSDAVEGFIPTSDGALIAGEPHAAATWFPVNDHPTDKATYAFHVTVPSDLQVVANGILSGTTPAGGGRTTWDWVADDAMASYLATIGIGHWSTTTHTEDGIVFVSAVDPALNAPTAVPSSGTQFAISGAQANNSYKRLLHPITVPAGGATVSFKIDRNTEEEWDFTFVEVHTVGQDDWTTLADANGHTSQDVGFSCPFWLGIHPFLGHYQSDDGQGSCLPTGSTGAWNAATGASEGAEDWSVNLGAFAGRNVELSISYASDDVVQRDGVTIDDVVVSTGQGTTSFEADGNELDGWTVPGAPAGSPGNDSDWFVGTAADTNPPVGGNAQASLELTPEVLRFESERFGDYPFASAGGIVDDVPGLGFALETQTRIVYATDFFTDGPNSGVIVHENAHQWFGDDVSVQRWKEIWLNEGFATYAEWLWSEEHDEGTAQEIFDFFYDDIFGDPEDVFWTVVIGDPGTDLLFDFAVYARGAMTLHQLRLLVGDEAFFDILQTWHSDHAGGNGTTAQFIALAESISGLQLDDFFQTWLYTPEKPVLPNAVAKQQALSTAATATVFTLADAPSVVRNQIARYDRDALASQGKAKPKGGSGH